MSTSERVIAWVGGIFFMEHMQAHGLRPIRIPLTKPEALTFEDITERCGCVPDAVVYTDRSLPPPLLGVERFPCLTAFYCIDSHIHSWYPVYAGAFDLCAVSLRDHVERFARELSPRRAIWLPPYADDYYQPRQADKDFDLLFVGTVNPETTPQRCDFLNRLGALCPGLTVRQGDFRELMPRAKVVLNIAERGDLNFRVFESLGCGSCLLTPGLAHGQGELFHDGEHFASYTGDDEADCAAKVRELLADANRREALAQAGLAQVNASHRPWQRAEAFAKLLRQGFDDDQPGQRLAAPHQGRKAALRLMWLHWAENCGDAALAARHLHEAKNLGARG
ncbi:MAG: glycosyltransferase [Humidesulfovibrio sp.]|uniref:glycosyltransferase family protein n=1 Tax=Humidesulfovibrio sp. TaxID=2910988 RepID=UPI0027330CB6|nr:glycosyltransferase [Humidesulfovibrio sp.]MDP2847721.1 glycosyltransferase [Humidesulfovibrio sp.]